MGNRKIVMHFGGTEVRGVLNGTETARAFAAKLPTRVRVSGTGICGRMPFDLPYDQEQVGFGWENGDINYNPGGGWFAVLFDDQENSQRYGDQVNIGKVVDPLDVLHGLHGSYEVLVEAGDGEGEARA